MRQSRRNFLKKVGAASGASVAASMAGCTGGGGGDGDGDGGTAMGTPTEELQEVRITLGPEGFAGIVTDYITNQTSVLQDRMGENGYTATVQQTFEGSALFAAGGPDFANFSTIEAATLGPEREIELAVTARVAANWIGFWVKPDTPYAVGGDALEAFRRFSENDATIGVGSFAGGDVPAYKVIAAMADLNFSEETDDFDIRTADYFALGQLVVDGQLDAGSTGPALAMVEPAMNGEVVPSFYIANFLADQEGFGAPDLNNWVVTQEFLEENRGAVEALVQAWHEGAAWLHDDPIGIVTEEENMEKIGAETEAQAEYLAEWGITLEQGLDHAEIYEDNEVTDAFIEQDTNFLNSAAELGTLPSDWEDWVAYEKIPQE